MSARAKSLTRLRDILTGEIIAECELTAARARAIIKAYALAGLMVEAVA
jgi:hypothetical protein